MPGKIVSMKEAKFSEGDPVRVTSGVYEGAEGVVEDLQPECSAVRIRTKSGSAYGFIGMIDKIVKPMPMQKSVIRKR